MFASELAPPAASSADPTPVHPRRNHQPDRMFSNLLFAAAMTCHAPVSVVAVAEPDGLWTTHRYGIGSREALPDDDFFDAIAGSDGPLEIVDLPLDPRFGDTLLAHGPAGIHYVYAIPLRAQGSPLLGVLCVFDRRTRHLSNRECQGFAIVAGKLADRMAVNRRTGRLGGVANPVAAGADEDEPGEEADYPAAARQASIIDAVTPPLLRAKDVAALFAVTSRTATNWATANRLPSFRTAGGHLRFHRDDVLALLASRPFERRAPSPQETPPR